MALDTAFLIGGVIITEQIFSISGMGRGVPQRIAARRHAVPARVVLRQRDRSHPLQPARRRHLRRARPADPVDVTVRPTVQPAPVDDAARSRAPNRCRASNWQLFRRRFFRHKLALVSLAILGAS